MFGSILLKFCCLLCWFFWNI